MSDGDSVVVRRRFDGADTTVVSAESFWDLRVRNEPGGVCRALPRGFLFARVWCDKLAPGALGHACRESPPPHELLVCILPTDNSAALYGRLIAQARG
jgi:hypothetical protein